MTYKCAPVGRFGRLHMARGTNETGVSATVIEMVDSLHSQDAPQSRPAVVQQVRDWLREAPPQGVAAAQRAMASRPDRLFVLQTLQVPALVLYGSEDAITGSADHEVMARALGTEAVRIDGAGHLAAVEAPKEVAQALEELYHRAGGPG